MNPRNPRYVIEHEGKRFVIIRDIGPWDQHLSVTNGAEAVVAELAERVGKRTLLYFDTEGDLDELLIKDGRFAGFKAWTSIENRHFPNRFQTTKL